MPELPLWVKSTFSDARGTQIMGGRNAETKNRRLTGITHTGKLVYIRLEIENADHKTLSLLAKLWLPISPNYPSSPPPG